MPSVFCVFKRAIRCLSYWCFFIKYVLLVSWCFSRFSILVFWLFCYDMPRYGSLWVYSTWNLLCVLNVQINVFIKFGKFLVIISWINSLSPLFFWISHYMCIDVFDDDSQVSETVHFFSLLFHSLDWIISANLSHFFILHFISAVELSVDF